MSLPEGITPKTATVGMASFFDGTAAQGTATVIAPTNVVYMPTATPLFASAITARLDNGSATFQLCPTDAPGLSRVDWTYTLVLYIEGATQQPDPINFVLPSDGPTVVDLDSLITLPSTTGAPVAVQAVVAMGGITTLLQLTQAAYDALAVKAANTLYLIVG